MDNSDAVKEANGQSFLKESLPIYVKNKNDQNLKVAFDSFDETWEFKYSKVQKITGYGFLIGIEIDSDNIDENGRPKYKNWKLWIGQRDDDLELQSVEIKTEKKNYLIKAKNGIAKIINVPQEMYEILNSLNDQQLNQMKEKSSEIDSIINILDIGIFKMRLNFGRLSQTLPESSKEEIKQYCAEFLKDINVDVRSVLNNDQDQKINVETVNAVEEKLSKELDGFSDNKPMSFYKKSKVKFYLVALVLIFIMTVALNLSMSIFLLFSLSLAIYIFIIDR